MATVRRIFTREFKVQAVELVTEQGDSFAEAARKLDRRENLVRRWKAQLASEGEQAFRGQGVPLVEDELVRLRTENKRRAMESHGEADALHMAIRSRYPEAGLLAHSDRGSQYASEYYQRQLAMHGIRCRMSRRGNCWDNAPMESFFASPKKELVHHERYETMAEARSSLFKSIEVFCNRERRRSSLGYVAPAKFKGSEYS